MEVSSLLAYLGIGLPSERLMQSRAESVRAELTDVSTDDLAGRRDEEGCRQPEESVPDGDPSAGIRDDRIGDQHLGQKRPSGTRRVVGIDPQKGHLALFGSKSRLQERHLGAARNAPGGPEVDHEWPTPKGGWGDESRGVRETPQRERGCGCPSGARE